MHKFYIVGTLLFCQLVGTNEGRLLPSLCNMVQQTTDKHNKDCVPLDDNRNFKKAGKSIKINIGDDKDEDDKGGNNDRTFCDFMSNEDILKGVTEGLPNGCCYRIESLKTTLIDRHGKTKDVFLDNIDGVVDNKDEK